jgi:hypothetical protein
MVPISRLRFIRTTGTASDGRCRGRAQGPLQRRRPVTAISVGESAPGSGPRLPSEGIQKAHSRQRT